MPTNAPFFWRCSQLLGKIVTKLFFNLKVEGRQHIPATGGVLIVSNHQSYLDPIVLAAFLRRPLNFVAKAELFHNPLAAWFLRQLNGFPLRNGKGDIGALKETIRRLHEGHLLNIFPEGSRSPDGQIHPFERGVALIIRRTNVPVVPAVITGAYDAWPLHHRLFRFARIRVTFGPPLHLDTRQSDQAITAAIEHEIRRMFHAAGGNPYPLADHSVEDEGKPTAAKGLAPVEGKISA